MARIHRRIACALLYVSALSAPAAAQSVSLARADSVWKSGDRELARQLYAQVLAADSFQSRAVFRLAETAGSPRDGIRLFERYTVLEPADPWGYMALGDALARAGRTRAALEAYGRAASLAPDERDVALGRSRVLSRAGRPEAAGAELTTWLTGHPDDAEAWELLARERLRAGRPRAAALAAARAESLGASPSPSALRRRARSQAAPFLEPSVNYQHDSDENETVRFGLVGDVAIADGSRAAVGAARGEVSDALESIEFDEASGRLLLRPRSGVQLRLQGGVQRFGVGGGAEWTTATGDARLRVRAPLRGPALELRAQRSPLAASPLLVLNRATRTEFRGTLELPVGALRIRGGGRAGMIDALGDATNTRTGADVGLSVPFLWQGELSAQYHRLAYQNPSVAGYFAPRLVETREAGTYIERETDGGVVVSLDLGAGVQRVAEHGAGLGKWERALRAWSSLALPLGAGGAIWTELEAYDAPFAPEGVTTSASWRFFSVAVGLRWRL